MNATDDATQVDTATLIECLHGISVATRAMAIGELQRRGIHPPETAPQDRRFLAKVWNMHFRSPTAEEITKIAYSDRAWHEGRRDYRRSGTQWIELWFNPSAGEFKEWAGSPRTNVSGSPQIIAWVELPDGDNEIKAQY